MKNRKRQEKANVHDILSKNKKLWLAAAVAGTVCGLALSTTQVSASTDQATDQQSDNNITKPAQQDKNHQIQLDQQDNQQQNSPQGDVQAQTKQPRARQVDDENDGLTLKVNYPQYNPGSGTGQTVTFSAGGVAGQQTIQAGDKVTITIPVGIYKLGTVQSIPAEYGSTIYKQVGDNYVITDTFDAVPAQVFQQSITLLPISYWDKMNMNVGDATRTTQWFARTKTITAKVSDGRQTSISFEQVVTPYMNPSMNRRSPAGGNGDPALLVHQDYEWQVDVQEDSRLYGDFSNTLVGKSWALQRFNGAINTRGTITIPVPASFVLNAAQTKARNNSNSITVTQAGKGQPVIITDTTHLVGDQSWDNQSLPYIIVGHFDMEQPEHNTEVHFGTDANPVTLHQELAYGIGTLDGTAKWTETILGKNAPQGPTDEQIAGRVYGYQTNDELPLDHETLRTVNHISFQNNSAQNLHNAVITVDVPDGLNVYSFGLPQVGSLDHFAYHLTFVDGTSTSGTVTAGTPINQVTTPIKQIQVTLPTWPIGAGTGPITSYFGQNTGGLILYGTVARTYRDSGQEVKAGDKVRTNLTIAVANLTESSYDVQTLIANQVIQYADLEVNQRQWGPGYTNAGEIRVQYDNGNDQTAAYFVLPENAVLTPGTERRPGVTIFQANGRTVVKVTKAAIYSDTYYAIYLDNAAPAIASNKQVLAYLYPGQDSVLLKSSYTHDPFETVADADLPFVEGHRGAFLVSREQDGSRQSYWRIMPTNATGTISGAQGNKDSMPVTSGHSDDHGALPMTFHSQLINTSMNTLTNVVNIVNLPETGFRFELTGPARAVDLQGNVLSNVRIMYSTAQANLHLAPGQKNDVTGFETSVADWSAVRSVAVIVPSLVNGGIIDLELPGQDPALPEDAGKQAALSSVTTATELNDPFIIEPGQTNSASIAVTGQSTVKARFHYKDEQGQDHYIDLADLSKTYQDNQDQMPRTDFPRGQADFSADDLAKIPTGYQLATTEPTIVNSAHGDYENGYKNETAEFGKQVKYYFDGDIVQYELTKKGNSDKPTTPPKNKPTTPPRDKPTTPPKEKPTTPPEDKPTTPPEEKPTQTPASKPDTAPEDKHKQTPTLETPFKPGIDSEPMEKQVATASKLGGQHKQAPLPQTGQTKATNWLGLGIAMILGLFGLAGRNKKRRN